MKLLIKTVLLVTSIGFLVACTGRIVHMQDNQGNNVTCEVSMGSAMMTGVLARDGAIDNCIKDREKAGFKVISEE